MAKKAKRRGRPPGSKNKSKVVSGSKGIAKSFAKMEVTQLRSLIDDLQGLLSQKVQEQRLILEGRLAELQGYVSQKAAGVVRSVMRVPKANGRNGSRAKPAPKYQSKKDKSLKWAGRGLMPRWMREEMKGTKLTKDSFLIK
jgi:DNA-binding protein H-NS